MGKHLPHLPLSQPRWRSGEICISCFLHCLTSALISSSANLYFHFLRQILHHFNKNQNTRFLIVEIIYDIRSYNIWYLPGSYIWYLGIIQSVMTSWIFACRWSSTTMTLRYLWTQTDRTTTTRSLRWTLWTKRRYNLLFASKMVQISGGTFFWTSPMGTVALRTPQECLEMKGNLFSLLYVRCWHVVVYFGCSYSAFAFLRWDMQPPLNSGVERRTSFYFWYPIFKL